MITSSQLNTIKTLLPSQLSAYLAHQGWFEDGELGEIVTIWHRNENEYLDFEILQPKTTDIKDYHQRVCDLVEVLSEFEQRAIDGIVNDLNNFYADVIKIRVIHDDVEGGSIPLNDGVLLFEKAKELLVSVVRSTYNKRKYFSGGKLTEDIAEYLSNMRLGQTEHGSYIVNLIAPIIHKDGEQEDLVKTSVTRAITENLSRSLTAIDNAIEEYKRTQSTNSFDGAVDNGVSANLCDALIGISGETKDRDIRVVVSLSAVEESIDGAKLEHKFDSTSVPYLQIASDYYKEKYVLYDQVVYGLVTKLSHEEEEDVGTVTIEATVNDVDKSVSIELSIEEYWQAHRAHKKLQVVECLGDLHVTPRSARLVNTKEFRVYDNQDMFDED